MKKLNILTTLIVLGGLFLRFLFPLQRVFCFDQEQIAVAAGKIIAGHPTLIGPLAGLINFFTGPLIYYLAALSYWLTGGHPLANTLVGISIYLISVFGLWYFLRQLITRRAAVIFLGIYSFSAYLVTLDRITWNPNLSFISAGLVLTGLLYLKGKWSLLMGGLGMWLAYQAHFSAFVMMASVILISLCLKRWRFLLAALFGLLVSLLPTFIFDLRHDWLNFQGLRQMLTNTELVSGGLLIQNRFLHGFLISLENLTKIALPILPQWSLIGLGVLIIMFWLRLKPSIFNQTQRIILISWILIFPLVIMFYRGPTPEYYFLMQLPAGVFILTDILINIRIKSLQSLTFLALFLISLGIVIDQQKNLAAGSSLRNKLMALQYIKENLADQPMDLILDMGEGDRLGWEYLLSYQQLSRGENLIKTHLIYPVSPGAILTAKFGGIGIWKDERGTIPAQAFVDNIHGNLFYYPNDYWQMNELERIIYYQNSEIKITAFIPQDLAGHEAIESGILYAYLPKKSEPKYFKDLDQRSNPVNLDPYITVDFLSRQLAGRKTVKRVFREDLFIFSFPQSYTWQEVQTFLSQVDGFR